MILLKTLVFTFMRPGLIVGLAPILLLSGNWLAAALVALLVCQGLSRLMRQSRSMVSAVVSLSILGEAAAFRSLPLLLYALLILDGLVFRRQLRGPTAVPLWRSGTLLRIAGKAVVLVAVIPWLLLRAEHMAPWLGNWRLVGLVLICMGACTYAWCAWNFISSGRGTPGSKTPTEALVVVGLYRLSRNPMYVAMLSILLGEAVLFRSVTLAVYTLLMLQRFRTTVVSHEEPYLRKKFGTAYEEYLRSVPRWIPGIPDLNGGRKQEKGRPTQRKERTSEDVAEKDSVCQLTEEIGRLIPSGEQFILVDQDEWGTPEVVSGRRRIPFLEHDGQYWGAPDDDETAIRELERLRQAGASFMVFGWPAFWWLEHYAGLSRYLRSQFRCLLESDRLVVFDLRA